MKLREWLIEKLGGTTPHEYPLRIMGLPLEPGETFIINDIMIKNTGTTKVFLGEESYEVCYPDGLLNHSNEQITIKHDFEFKKFGTICPRCGGEVFKEIDCGPDSYDDDFFYISKICKKCGLYNSGWTDKWFIDCKNWRDEEDAEEFKGRG